MFGLSTRRKMVIAGCVLIAVAAGLACNDQPHVAVVVTSDVGVVGGGGGRVNYLMCSPFIFVSNSREA